MTHAKILKTGSTLVLLLLSIVGISSLPDSGLFWANLLDSSHSFVFFLLTYFLTVAFTGSTKRLNKKIYLVLLGILSLNILLGAAIELLQPLIGRERSFLDWIYDIAGTGAGILFFLGIELKKRPVLNLLLALTLLVASLILPAMDLITIYKRNANFPKLLTFDHPWESAFYAVDTNARFTILQAPPKMENGTKVGLISFISGQYPGLTIEDFVPDWSEYEYLYFEFFSEQPTPLLVNLRLQDKQHNNEFSDRFNKKLVILPGNNQFKISLHEIEHAPHSRKINLSQMDRLLFFMRKPQQPTQLFLDNLQLK